MDQQMVLVVGIQMSIDGMVNLRTTNLKVVELIITPMVHLNHYNMDLMVGLFVPSLMTINKKIYQMCMKAKAKVNQTLME